MADNLIMTPVAEYKGVGIIERGGNVPKTYMGHPYTTDGYVYILRSNGHKHEAAKFKTERELKDAIDAMPVEQRLTFLTLDQTWELLKQPNPMEDYTYRFDEAKEQFVPVPALKQGQQRFRPQTR